MRAGSNLVRDRVVSNPQRFVVRENAWGRTTGKHLNIIDGGGKEARAARLPSNVFEQAYATRNDYQRTALP